MAKSQYLKIECEDRVQSERIAQILEAKGVEAIEFFGRRTWCVVAKCDRQALMSKVPRHLRRGVILERAQLGG